MKLLLENISHDEFKDYIKEFYKYALERLKINKHPKLFLKQDENNAKDMFGKTGYYNPDKKIIVLYITDRHPKDILRSFAHELVHHEQECLGKNKNLDLELTAKDPAYATNNKGLREMEREAFEKGNLIFRDWCDSKKIEMEKQMDNKDNIPYSDLFKKKDRALDKVKTDHENDLFNELLNRYIEKEKKEEQK